MLGSAERGAMNAEQVIRIALTMITPILTAGIGIVALVIGDWRERRTQAGRRKVAFEDASRQVAFAADWWNASKLLADHSPGGEERAATRTQAWLDEASALVAESHPPPVDEKPGITLVDCFSPTRCNAAPQESFGAPSTSASVWWFFKSVRRWVPPWEDRHDRHSQLLLWRVHLRRPHRHMPVMTVIAMAFRFSALHVEESEADGSVPAANASSCVAPVPIQTP